MHAYIPIVRILVQMVDSICIESGGPTLYTVHLVALAKQKLG